MKRRTTAIISAAAATVLIAAGGVTYAQARSSDDDGTDTPITGADLERASAAALQATGGGRVTGSEVGDEESEYEVEVTLDDGTQVDVQLDGQFHVVSSGADVEESGADD